METPQPTFEPEEGTRMHPPNSNTPTKGVMKLLTKRRPAASSARSHGKRRKHGKLGAAATVGALVLGTVVLGAGSAFAGLAPGSQPDAGPTATFSDGSVHHMGGWRLGGVITDCIDAERLQPTGGTSYTTSTVPASKLAWVEYTYGRSTDPSTAAARAYYAHHSTEINHKDASPWLFNNYTDPSKHVPNTAAITAKLNEMTAGANAHAGPLSVKITSVINPTATSNSGSFKVAVVNTGGVDQAGYKLALSGATGMSPSVTSASTPVTVKFTALNSQKGTIKASAANLPPTTIKMYTPANGSFQRTVTTSGLTLSAAASAPYARPAVPTGSAQAVKVSAANASLGVAGAQIHVHAGSATGADKGTLTTQAGGKSNVLTLAPGTYVGVETVAPTGYLKNAANVTFTVTAGKTSTITFKDSPVGSAQAVKVSTANAGLGLAGAQIHVHAGTAAGADKGTLTTTTGGKSNVLTLAPGKYVGVETVTPAGYQRNAANVTFTVTTGKTSVITFRDSPIPGTGAAQAIKVSSTTALGLAGAQIHVHAGTATGADKGTLTTTTGGKSNVLALAPGTYVGVETVSPAGYQRDAANVTFTVTSGKTSSITFKDSPVVPKESAVSVLKGADDTTGTVAGKYGPLAGTTWTAASSDGKTVLGTDVSDSDGKVFIPVDVVPGTDVLLTETSSGSADYTVTAPMHVTSTLDGSGTALYTAVDHRIPAPKFTLTKTIVDPATHQVMPGKPPAGAYYRFTNLTTGQVVAAKVGPTDADGKLTGTLPNTHNGDQVQAVEIISPITGAIDPTPIVGTVTTDAAGNMRVVVAQADVPVTIGTNASNQKDGSKFYVPGDVAVDAVDYHGVLPGRPATANANASCLNSDGSLTPIPNATGTTTFTPTSSSGTVNVTVKLPSGMKPCVVSVYEQLVISGTVVAEHNKGGTAPHQQLWSPSIGTTLTNKAGGGNVFHPGDTGIDAVAYTGVQPGVATTVKGTASCINPATGVLTPIPGATNSVTFTPTGTSGTVEVPITLPKTMAPCTITVYEQWIVGGVQRADHNKNGKDVSEQGFQPQIGTLLTNAANGSKYFAWGDTGIDAVAYSGLQPGVVASLEGTAYCLNTDNTLSAIPGATATQAFTASASGAGTVNVTIKIPTELGTPCTITVVEKLLIGGKVVQTHNTNGLDHQEQGHMPWLKTTLVGPAGGKATVIDSASTTLTDQVACFDVINGEKYYVTGDLRIDDNTVKGKTPGSPARPRCSPRTARSCAPRCRSNSPAPSCPPAAAPPSSRSKPCTWPPPAPPSPATNPSRTSTRL